MYQIATEQATDAAEVEFLLDTTFAPGRTALSSYRLRDGVPPVEALCLVARDDLGVVAGAIRHWPVRIGPQGTPALLVGPVAVHHTRQGEGLGGALINHALDRAIEAGWRLAVLIGDEPYYSRFGFRRVHDRGIEFPPPTNPDRILGKELVPGALEGVSGLVEKWAKD